jgi:hypothetical protein
MVKNVNEHNCIDAGLAMRKVSPVEGSHGQAHPVTNQDIDSLDAEIRAPIEERSRQPSVTRANVQNTAARRYQLSDKL